MNYLRTLEKGCAFNCTFSQNSLLRSNCHRSLVFVEANYEVREPNREAEPGSIDSQRTVFLRQGKSLLKMLRFLD